MRRAASGLCLLLLVAVAGAVAEEAARPLARIPLGDLDSVPVIQHGREHAASGQRPAEKAEPALPPEVASRHSVALPDRTLSFTAKAGAATFEDAQGAAIAEIGYFAYLLDGSDVRRRPVTFVINGGPGSASAWLHLGALGPWRLPITQATAHPTAPADPLPNAETWLDFTDLVFIDPVGTGFARLNQKDKAVRDKFWSVQGDVSSIAVFIKRWLEANGRLDSPKVFLGESYGGFRAPRLAQALQAMPGLALNGIILVSPALATPSADFPGTGTALLRVAQFPSLAAAIADARGPVSADQLAAFEREAVGGYLADMLAGPRDAAAVDRLAGRIAGITGIDIDTVRHLGPRSGPQVFLGAIDRKFGRTYSNYDATEKRMAAYDGPALVDSGDDLGGLAMRLARAASSLARGPLGWKVQRDYQMRGVGWSWSGQESATALRSALVRDQTFRVLIVHGYADLVTPYFRTKLMLRQMPIIGADDRVRLQVYRGGHMLYSRDDSRALFRKDAVRFYEAIGPP